MDMNLTFNGNTINVTLVNANTQKAQTMVNNYMHSSKSDIYEAYKKPSDEKVRTFALIKQEMKKVNGSNLRITGAGCDIYSCAYKVGGYLIYHTPIYRYAIKLN